MRLTQQQENEILAIYEKWLNSYLSGDIETYDSYFDKDFQFIGSTNNEEFLNRKDTTEFFRKTSDQFSGKTDLRNNIKTVEIFGNIVFITHLFDAWFLNKEDWTYYGRFRFSNALHETKDGWRFIYQHFSIPDAKAEEGETIGFDQISAENLQLREAIKRRTKELEEKSRELQIEMALEKVRARSLEMQHTSELQDVINTVHQELLKLELPLTGGAFIVINSDIQDELWCWGAGGTADYVKKVNVPFIDKPIYKGLVKGIQKGPGFFTEAFSHKEKIEFFEHLFKHPPYLNSDESHKIEVFSRDGGYTRSCAVFRNTSIFIINHHGRVFTEFENSVLKRFGSVFEQAYTRFLDLKKAEAQAREAQFEAALERVRSRTMTMQHSNELPEAANVLFNEVRKLGIPAWSAGYNILSEDKRSSTCIMSSEGELQVPFVLPLTEHESLVPWHTAIVDNLEFFVYGQDGEDLVAHYDYMTSLPELKSTFEQFQKAGLDLPTQQFNHLVRFDKGFLLFITYEEVPEAHRIFQRFGKVFEQTYTRFLDLQKAEAQARQAQIETALERLRSRSMGMQKSEELADLSLELVKQVQKLGVTTWFCAFNIYDDDERGSLEWGSNGEGVFPKYRTPREGVFLKYFQAGQDGEDLLVNEIGEDECPAHYDYLCTLPGVGEQLLKIKAKGIPFPTSQIDHVAFFKYGYIIFITYEPVPESHEIFKRFARVFEQTYTRFLDLQKAEERAREARIETALEKVRSRTLAMEHSKEFTQTSIVVFKQLLELGISPNRLFIGIIDRDTEIMDAWATNEEGTNLENKFRLVASENKSISRMIEGWKQGRTSQVIDMKGEELKQYFQYMGKELKIPFQRGLEQKRRIQYLAYFSGGVIGMAAGEEQDDKALELLERFAGVFNLTYIRFKDLKVAEANAIKAEQDLKEIKNARENAEKALTELQQTQKQLIQSEKMASLGELTAGIAHEIQNPLNFVNNFSEVSSELLDEISEEFEKGNLDEVREILHDIRNNLYKINNHGKRADAIVKGMLQHSRKGNSEKELTDINALCDEYLRLSFHGFRAKDKTFKADFELRTAANLPKIKVIPQDLGRVILNLINNAFYVVDERAKNEENFEPRVEVRTKKNKESLQISVTDNGPGIPDHIREKIFQPFFTTKPTGRGTGLGLSLSYDIVKAHGGVLEVDTKKGKGTTFTIILNLN